jgi:hypothetical protein
MREEPHMSLAIQYTIIAFGAALVVAVMGSALLRAYRGE